MKINIDFLLKAIYATTTTSRCSTTIYSNGCSTAVSTTPNRFIIKYFYKKDSVISILISRINIRTKTTSKSDFCCW
jgi:hypothetical protein